MVAGSLVSSKRDPVELGTLYPGLFTAAEGSEIFLCVLSGEGFQDLLLNN